MILENFKSERLLFKKFSELTEEQKRIVGDSWANPFNARYNAMSNPYKAVEEMCEWDEPTEWLNYYRVVFSLETGEIVGTCRFGKWYKSETYDVWDFGFNVVLKHWFNGYGVEILKTLIDVAKSEGVKTIIGGADVENFGSYKAMIKNGFKFLEVDDDGDYRYYLDLTKEIENSKEQTDKVWKEHLDRARRDFGEDKYKRLFEINNYIFEMVKKIKLGEDEKEMTAEYYKKLNEIEPFKFS